MKTIVDLLGGRAAVCRKYEVGDTSISNWLTSEAFPAKLHFRLFNDLQSIGWDCDPTDPRTIRKALSDVRTPGQIDHTEAPEVAERVLELQGQLAAFHQQLTKIAQPP